MKKTASDTSTLSPCTSDCFLQVNRAQRAKDLVENVGAGVWRVKGGAA